MHAIACGLAFAPSAAAYPRSKIFAVAYTIYWTSTVLQPEQPCLESERWAIGFPYTGPPIPSICVHLFHLKSITWSMYSLAVQWLVLTNDPRYLNRVNTDYYKTILKQIKSQWYWDIVSGYLVVGNRFEHNLEWRMYIMKWCMAVCPRFYYIWQKTSFMSSKT